MTALTDARARALKGTGKWYSVPDGVVPGLTLRVTPAGSKTLSLMYRNAAGKMQRKTLGQYPEVTLAAARAAARILRREVSTGADPQAELMATRRAPKPAPAALPETFGALVGRFLADIAANRYRKARGGKPLRPATVDAWQRIIRVELEPRLGALPLAEVTADRVRAQLEELAADRPYWSNRVLEVVQRVYTWSLEQGRVQSSPVAGLRPIGIEERRERVLSSEEIARVWPHLTGPFGRVSKLLFLTGARRGEVLGMAWAEIDLGMAVWRLGSSRTKQGAGHTLPLVPQAVALLQEISDDAEAARAGDPLRRNEPPSPWVFPGPSGGPIVSPQKFMAELRRRSGVDFRLHDVRRSVATGLAELGTPGAIVEAVLGHAAPGVAATYNRYLPLKEMRAALAKWADHLERITSPEAEAPRVVRFRQ